MDIKSLIISNWNKFLLKENKCTMSHLKYAQFLEKSGNLTKLPSFDSLRELWSPHLEWEFSVHVIEDWGNSSLMLCYIFLRVAFKLNHVHKKAWDSSICFSGWENTFYPWVLSHLCWYCGQVNTRGIISSVRVKIQVTSFIWILTKLSYKESLFLLGD